MLKRKESVPREGTSNLERARGDRGICCAQRKEASTNAGAGRELCESRVPQRSPLANE